MVFSDSKRIPPIKKKIPPINVPRFVINKL